MMGYVFIALLFVFGAWIGNLETKLKEARQEIARLKALQAEQWLKRHLEQPVLPKVDM